MMMMMVKKRRMYSWEILPRNNFESLLPCLKQIRQFATVSGADKTFGLWDKDGKFYIENKKAKIKENNIIVGNKEYAGTSGLWELIVVRSPDDKIFTNGIMIIMLK